MLKRRHFLQFTGSTLATVGFSQLDIFHKANHYAQVLSQNTPRKLALLVGVNKYRNLNIYDLNGCVTDVKLQETLLIHRFGFKPQDILRLSDDPKDKKPTRQNILTAFEEHLIKQAKPGDVVVFHFSGHGSRLPEPDPIQECRNDKFNSTLLPADTVNSGVAQDIMGRTLFLLMSALNTENVTVILDSCFSGGGTRGNFLIRSVPRNDDEHPSAEEIAYQQSWMTRLNISPQELAHRRCQGVAKGVVIAAAQKEEVAVDTYIDGFSAGVFTYFLTQYLWQKTGNVESVINKITPAIQLLFAQHPLVDGEKTKPVYFINNKIPPTDAVIIQSEGERATLWLGGVDKESLETFRPGATFAVVNDKGIPFGKVELVSPRSGLTVEGKLVEKKGITSLKPGMLLQESTRVVRTDLKLSIGLDPSLASDTNTAKEALSAINRIEAVTASKQNPPYPNGVQYIFSRITPSIAAKLQQQQINNIPPVKSVGLFTQGFQPILPSFGHAGETVTDAVKRLEPKLKYMLAVSVLKKTLNTNSSELDLEVSINLVDKPNQILAMTSTARNRNNRRVSEQIYPHKLPLQKLFQFRVTNHESTPVYFSILIFDYSGDLLLIFPYEWPASEQSMLLAPKQLQVVGDPAKLKLRTQEKGTGEALIIASRKPLKNAVKTMEALAYQQNRNRGVVELRGSSISPDEVIANLLNDLRDERGGTNVAREATPVSNSDMATLSITFDIG